MLRRYLLAALVALAMLTLTLLGALAFLVYQFSILLQHALFLLH